MGTVATHSENRMSKGPRMKIAPPEEATGDLKRAYDRIRTTRGRIPDIRSVMAGEPFGLSPETLVGPAGHATSAPPREASKPK
jgi:hypothetical protein